MLFSSSIFLFMFLPIVVIIYQILGLFGKRLQIYFLLLSSFIFYAWGEPKYIWIMLLIITINYLFGMLISASVDRITQKTLLFSALAGNLGILFYFKYMCFTLESINLFFHTDFALHNIVMPIGISFFTFQGMSYIIDIYRKDLRVQKNPALVAFYISFFPQLIAGPIVRYIDIEEQLYIRKESLKEFSDGAKRFTLGLSKKVLIANTLGFTAEQIFANGANQNTLSIAWLGIICYTFQIYFDFSGYSDMALGLGKMFGFKFPENFNYPYISKTVTEFWRRWHISLSTWFRDYVYIPLGGNRAGNVYLNLLIVFIITGLWHGASFNFLVWGLWHGTFLILERALKMTKAARNGIVPLRYALTMLIVIIGWVFFRVEELGEALQYIGVMFGVVAPQKIGFTIWYYLNYKVVMALFAAVVASVPISNRAKLLFNMENSVFWEITTSAFILLLLLASIFLVISSTYNPFIYFRF